MVAPVRPSPAGTDRRVGSDPTTVVRAEGTGTVVILQGEWDFSTRAMLADVLSRVIASGAGDVAIDLAETEFVDTAAVRVLFDAQEFLECRGRRLTFRSPSSMAVQVLDLFGLTDLIQSRGGVQR